MKTYMKLCSWIINTAGRQGTWYTRLSPI